MQPRRIVAVLGLAAALTAPGLWAQNNSAAVIRAVHAYDAAWTRRDTAMLRTLLAPVYRYQSGATSYDRTQTLASIGLPNFAPVTSTRDSIQVQLTGAAASVTSVVHTRATMRGRPFNEDLRCALDLVEQPIWLVTAERCEKIAPPAPAKTKNRGH